MLVFSSEGLPCSATLVLLLLKKPPARLFVPEIASSCGSLCPFPKTPPKKTKKDKNEQTPPETTLLEGIDLYPVPNPRRKKKKGQTRLHASLERLTNLKKNLKHR
jgi:hypothetical protein